MSLEKKDQQTNIKFCFKLKKMSTVTSKITESSYGDDAETRSRASEWFSRF